MLHLGEEPFISVSLIILDGGSARDIWLRLEAAHQKDKIQSKLNVRNKLHNFKEEQDFWSQKNQFKKIFLDLAGINDLVKEKDQVGTIFSSLPTSFSAISMVADAQKLSFDATCAIIMSGLDRRTTTGIVPENTVSTPQLSLRNAKFPRRSGSDLSLIERFNCEKLRHMQRNCRTRLRGRIYKSRNCNRANCGQSRHPQRHLKGSGRFFNERGNRHDSKESHLAQFADEKPPSQRDL